MLSFALANQLTARNMPLVRIDVIEGYSEAQLTAIGTAVHQALTECLDVPPRDHFQVISEHTKRRLTYDPAYLGSSAPTAWSSFRCS
jgi:hypothetical protein